MIVDTNGNLNHADYKRMGKRRVMVGFPPWTYDISIAKKKDLVNFLLRSLLLKSIGET